MRTSDPTDPINALYGEHDEALAHLSLLGNCGRALAAGEAPSRVMDDLERAVGFLDEEIRAHNEWEEKNLFPRLERFTGPGGPCTVMRAEHRELWNLYGRLAPLREAVRRGEAEENEIGALASVATAIVDLLSAHIAKENEILFPMARRMLTPRDLSEMAAARG